MKKLLFFGLLIILMGTWSCAPQSGTSKGEKPSASIESDFEYVTERFADIRVLRYQVPGFELLSADQKKLLYYLAEAALAGRDMSWDQGYKHNLTIRRTLEAIVKSVKGDETGEFGKFMEYTKRVWFANGIHHHYSYDKFQPEFSKTYFAELVGKANPADLPLMEGETPEALAVRLTPILFDLAIAPKKVNKAPGIDHVKGSAVNFYEGVTEAEVEAFYKKLKNPHDKTPVSYGLNSKLVKENGRLTEKVWKIGGMYTEAIEKVVFWLEKAIEVAENDKQRKALELLVKFYQTGDLKDFDAYSIAWVDDTGSDIDVINGFIEVYNDPLGYRGGFESVVSIKDPEASKRIEAIGAEAQWFEDNSTIMEAHKKANVTGISARVINVGMLSGDVSPSSPIGINLPNANWIRAQHGSKSVNLSNIGNAYDEASKTSGGALKEFAVSEEEIERVKKHGSLADKLHTDMHEVIGHASGQINPGIGTPKETLKNYASTMEEGRADLVALYYLMDPKLVELGLMESLDVGKASYDDYIRNGMLTQLRRIKLGDNIEEDHMRNRAFIVNWAYEKGKAENVIEKFKKDGKTYVRINDYDKLRTLFGQLLRETQRIKSEGDFEGAKALVENYGVNIDQALHKEVLDRFSKLNVSPYSGFINPKLVPVMDGENMVDVKIEYPDDFMTQMLYYAEKYSFLPNYN